MCRVSMYQEYLLQTVSVPFACLFFLLFVQVQQNLLFIIYFQVPFSPLRILNNSTYDFHLYILLYHISCHIPMIFVQKNYFTNSYSNSSCLFSFFNEEKYFSKYSLRTLVIAILFSMA